MSLSARFFLQGILILGIQGAVVLAQESKPVPSDPEVFSLFPLAGERGKLWQAEVRGRNLEGAYGVWFDCDVLQATVKGIETIDLDAKSTAGSESPAKTKKLKEGQRVSLEIRANTEAVLGVHKFRLLSSRGVSNSFSLYVDRETVVLEDSRVSSIPSEAQRIEWPGVVSGRISKEGEVDYFGVEIPAGRELSFEVDSAGANLDPVVTLFEPSGSWFDPQSLKRVAYNDDATPQQLLMADLSFRSKKTQKYIVGIAAFVGLGGPDYSYRFRVSESSQGLASSASHPVGERLAHAKPPAWREREFARKIEPDRLKELWLRTVPAAAPGEPVVKVTKDFDLSKVAVASNVASEKALGGLSLSSRLAVVREKEPNGLVGEALAVSIPAIVEGAIEQPGDVDHYQIRVSAGQALAFEIQTRQHLPPVFSPRLELLDSSGEELLNNVYQRIGGDGDDWIQSLESKCIYTFDRGGDYTLRVKDLTSRNGSPELGYRLLIRPQIPHAGDIGIKEDRLNLVPGEAKKLTLTTAQEEGFDGQIAVTVDHLPPGVTVLPAADIQPPEGPPFAKVHPERFLPKTQTLTLMLYAENNAPATSLPSWIQVKVQPVVGGKPGKSLPVEEIPVMVLKTQDGNSESKVPGNASQP